MSRNRQSSRIYGRESAVGRAQVRRRFLRVKKPARETAPAPSSPLPKRSRASRRNSNAVVASCSGSLYRRNCSVVQLVSEHRPQAESVALVTPGWSAGGGGGGRSSTSTRPGQRHVCCVSIRIAPPDELQHQPVCSPNAFRIRITRIVHSTLHTIVYIQSCISINFTDLFNSNPKL